MIYQDFKKQLEQLKKMGSLSHLMNLLPKGGAFKNISKLDIPHNFNMEDMCRFSLRANSQLTNETWTNN